MNFVNSNISPDDLPSIESITFHPLERKYLKVQRLSLMIGMVVLLIIAVVLFWFIKKLQDPLIIYTASGVYLLIVIISWIGDGIGFRYSGYALRDKDILFRNGWLIRKARVVPLNRVQHVSIQSGPFERRFGLASVSVFTAGSGAADFTIKGITGEKAQQIKDWISNQLNGANN